MEKYEFIDAVVGLLASGYEIQLKPTNETGARPFYAKLWLPFDNSCQWQGYGDTCYEALGEAVEQLRGDLKRHRDSSSSVLNKITVWSTYLKEQKEQEEREEREEREKVESAAQIQETACGGGI